VEIILQRESFPQINFAHILIRQYLIRASGSHQRAVIKNISVSTDSKGLAHIMISNEHSDTALHQMADDPLDIDNGYRIDTRKRFVKKYESWLRRQGPRDLHAPPLAA